MREIKYYRDILLFPKFKNINKIQEIRKNCDELYNVIDSHITIVFPFLDDISDEELIDKIKELVKDVKKFKITFNGISYSDDDYVFLDCTKGEQDIKYLHDIIYNNVLKEHLSLRDYKPHITIGQRYNCNDYTKINNLTDIFEDVIDAIYIEKIGMNEESIILSKIDLK